MAVTYALIIITVVGALAAFLHRGGPSLPSSSSQEHWQCLGVIHSPAGLGIPLSLPDSVWSGLFPSGGNGDGTSALSHQASLYSVIISHIK